MKKQSLVKWALLLIALSVSVTIGVTNTSRAKDPNIQQQNENEDQMLKQILREQGLREAARYKKHYVGTELSHGYMAYDIQSLTRNSIMVVVGSPLQNMCKLSFDRESINTEYQVTIQEVIKGKVAQGNTITVNLPGGLVEFEDGTSAEIRTPGFRKMENGKTYVLFLKENKAEGNAFILVGGQQGLFELPVDGSGVNPHGLPVDEVVKQNKNKDVNAFLKEIRLAAKKWPETSPCCN
jgi:hypothetical protein